MNTHAEQLAEIALLRAALAVFANQDNWRETDWRSLGMSTPEWTWEVTRPPWQLAQDALNDAH